MKSISTCVLVFLAASVVSAAPLHSALLATRQDAAPAAGALKPASPDGKCGNGVTCLGFVDGTCCSQYGFCGKTEAHCGTGCNPAFGTCGSAAPGAAPAPAPAPGAAPAPAPAPGPATPPAGAGGDAPEPAAEPESPDGASVIEPGSESSSNGSDAI